MKKYLWLLSLFFLVSPAKADITLLGFQVNLLGVYQANESAVHTGQVAWIPSVGLGPFGVRGEIGATLLKDRAGSRFLATNFEGFLTLGVIPLVLTLEAGGGYAVWHSQNTSNPILSFYAVFSIPVLLERIYVAYSRFMIPGAAANELKLGVGFKF